MDRTVSPRSYATKSLTDDQHELPEPVFSPRQDEYDGESTMFASHFDHDL
jgi:hypothetical protein